MPFHDITPSTQHALHVPARSKTAPLQGFVPSDVPHVQQESATGICAIADVNNVKYVSGPEFTTLLFLSCKNCFHDALQTSQDLTDC